MTNIEVSSTPGTGQLETLADPDLNTTKFFYDRLNRLIKETNELSSFAVAQCVL